MDWWFEKDFASTATWSMKASWVVKPGTSGFILDGTATLRRRLSLVDLTSIGSALGAVVTHAKWRSLACFKASAGCSTRDAFAEAMDGPTHVSLFAQAQYKDSAAKKSSGESGRPRPILPQCFSKAPVHSFRLSQKYNNIEGRRRFHPSVGSPDV